MDYRSLWSQIDSEKEVTCTPDHPSSAQNNSQDCKCGIDKISVDGDLVCPLCGTLSGDFVSNQAEWRNFGSSDSNANSARDPSRCGNPVDSLLPKSSLCTIIAGNGRQLYRKLHHWKLIPNQERSLRKTFEVISAKCRSLELSQSIIADAKSMYKLYTENQICRGDNRIGIMAASVYYSCVRNDNRATMYEIATAFSIDINRMMDGCKGFLSYLHGHVFLEDIGYGTTEDFLYRYTSQLGLPPYCIALCKIILEKSKQNETIVNHTPPSIAAGIIYFVGTLLNEPSCLDKTKISAICHISEVTVQKSFKKFTEIKSEVKPYVDCILEKIEQKAPARKS